MKIATLFTPGSYGTFISWCVYSFSELNLDNNIVSPLEDNTGSGHGYRTTPGMQWVRPTHHPLDNSYTNYILVNFDKEKAINYIDNQYQKQSLGCTTEYMNSFFPNFNDKLKESWGANTANWELRELLSFFINNMINSSMDQLNNHHNQLQKNNCYTINPESFLLNTKIELEKLLSFFSLKKHVKFDLLESYALEYLKLQQNFTKNEQIDLFVEHTINNNSYSIDNLTIFDEALIQYKLRSQGIEVRCYNLNSFPTDATDLFGLLE